MDSVSDRSRLVSLPTKILLGMIVGAGLGVTLNVLYAPELGEAKTASFEQIEWIADALVKPFGDLFLRLLFMVVVPIVFCSLFLGVAGLGSVQRLGRLGGRTLLWFFGTSLFAGIIGIAFVILFAPGSRMDPEVAAQVEQQYLALARAKVTQGDAAKGWLQMIVDIVPENVIGAASSNKGILGLICFALLLGAASIRIAPEKTRVLRELCEGVYELCVKILEWTMRLAPLGVACLIFHASVRLGLPVMLLVGWYFATAMLGLLVYLFVCLPALAWGFARIRPIRFLGGSRMLLLTAFSTSSSNATLPTTMRTATDEFGVSKEVAGFVMPLGATMNMNGTALFLGVVVLFLAQVSGTVLDASDYGLVLGMTVLVAIGAAGVPGGSLPMLAVVLMQVGVPPELLALILGVDRIVDMTRTVPNVVSDLVCSLWMARRDGGGVTAG